MNTLNEAPSQCHVNCNEVLAEAKAIHAHALDTYVRAASIFCEAKAMLERTIGMNRAAILYEMTPGASH